LRRNVESLLASYKQAGTEFMQTNPLETAPLDAVPGIRTAVVTRIGTRVGDYQLVKEVGRGGMGDVYRAVRVDGHFDREVAIKLCAAAPTRICAGTVSHRTPDSGRSRTSKHRRTTRWRNDRRQSSLPGDGTGGWRSD
jgi:hypothetical protein